MSNNKKIGLIISLVSLTLVGLIGVQVYWALLTYRLAEKEFRAEVHEAMRTSVKAINDQLYSFETFSRFHLRPNEGFYMLKNNWKNRKFITEPEANQDTIPIYYNDPDYFKWHSLMFTKPVTISMITRYEYTSHNDVDTLESLFEKATISNFKTVFSGNKSIAERYDPAVTDSVLAVNLAKSGLPRDFYFGYINTNHKTLEYSRSSDKGNGILLNSDFKVALTPDDNFSNPYELSVIFPGKETDLLSRISSLLIVSGVIILALLISFYIFVTIILKQRKLSELKNDFISNMTHEFKTPLTNISLAVETLTVGNEALNEKQSGIMGIIGHEAERLRENVERVLQVARFEKDHIDLSLEAIDMHQLLLKVVAVFEIGSERTGAVFKLDLKAENSWVRADETHVFNMIYNLIDNGIKYNVAQPVISVVTANTAGGLSLRIRDNGIGISAAEQKRVFDKFYRIPRGNVHDVKGFGLGLSYVKFIADAHGWSLKLTSEPGAGTEFHIFIPAA